MARKPIEQEEEDQEQKAADTPNIEHIDEEWIKSASEYDWRQIFGPQVEVVYHACLDGVVGFEKVNDKVIRVWR